MPAFACERCSSAVCDGRVVTCLGCGVVQCHGNGLRNGSCSVCHFGILPGWSSWRKQCGYKGCDKPAAFHYVPGNVKTVCHDHATRPKITIYPRNHGERIPLAEYISRGLAAARFERGVVKPGEQVTLWPLYLSEIDESLIEAMITRARNTYVPFAYPEVK